MLDVRRPLSRSIDELQCVDDSMPLSVVIFGATGDLARKKLFPALYQVPTPLASPPLG